jgi:MarR family transcriptional regulator, organic hydroperoxide resistance regulator
MARNRVLTFDDPVAFEEVRDFWADVLGVRGPQWMIIVAVQKLDRGEGVLATAVATMLRVNPTFVLTQSRLLEKKGFIRRTAASGDSGIVSLSLTDKAHKHLAKLA